MDKHPLSESQEDYLEVILQLRQDKGIVRARDIAARLDVSRPSVTGALRVLGAEGLVHYEPYDVVTLTERGEEAASNVLQRHRTLQEFLVQVLQVGAGEAAKAACAMEHALSPAVFRRFVVFLKQFQETQSARKAGGIDGSK